jgi:hypothetical protein
MQIPYMNKNNETVKKSNKQWTELIAELFDTLTGKSARINYTFENLIIDIPRVVGPDGQNISAQWTVNGRHKATANNPQQ